MDYDGLENALVAAEAQAGAADAHGMLCGMLCLNPEVDLQLWVNNVIHEADPQNASYQDAVRALAGLSSKTRQQLGDPEFGFRLFLPDDDRPLPERLNALNSWCQGFLFGLACAGLQDHADLPGQSQELILDFLQIANAEMDESTEENETAFVEVSEYVRMGVLMVNEELQPLKPNTASSSKPTLH